MNRERGFRILFFAIHLVGGGGGDLAGGGDGDVAGGGDGDLAGGGGLILGGFNSGSVRCVFV